MLNGVDDWTDVNEAFLNRWSPIGVPELELLIEQGVLENAATHDDDQSQDSARWAHWGLIATNFHAVSRDARYPQTPEARQALAEEISSDIGDEQVFKQYQDVRRVPLPRSVRPLEAAFGAVLTGRRTHREFSDEPVGLDDLATLLHYTFGPQRFVDAGLFGTLPLKCSPSAGSRHEEECYIYARRVRGVPRGLYHYNGLIHSLEIIDDDISEPDLTEMTYAQAPCASASFVIFTTAVVARIANKYRHPRAYRLWMYNAGHYGQTFALTCGALGLGAFQTAAFLDSAVEAALGVDGVSEFAAYVLAGGIPVTQQHGEPILYHYPVASLNQ